MTLAGALVRVWFVMRHQGSAPAWVLGLGILFVVFSLMLVVPAKAPEGPAVPFIDVQKIIEQRCLSCHAEKPFFPGMAEAPKGVKLDTPGRARALALQIHQQTVLSKAMPPGNLTGMTEEERSLLDRWIRSGAK